MFRSLAFLLCRVLPEPLRALDVRLAAIEYIRYLNFYDQRLYRSCEDYTADLESGALVDFNCIRAAALYYDLKIVVHVEFGYPTVSGVMVVPRATIHLMYRGEGRYTALVSAEQSAELLVGGLSDRVGGDDVSVQLNRLNRLDSPGCDCRVGPMTRGVLSIPTFDQNGRRKQSVQVRNCVFQHLVDSPLRPDPDRAPFFFVEPSSDLPAKMKREVMDLLLEDGMFGVPLNQYSGSFGKSGRLIGVHTPFFNTLFRFEEQCYYASRALFNNNVAGVQGSIEVLRAPMGAVAVLDMDELVQVQIHDGWGFIKQSLAHELEQTLETEPINLRNPRANYGMFQWLRPDTDEERSLENATVEELSTRGIQPEPGEHVQMNWEPWEQSLVTARPEMRQHPVLVERATLTRRRQNSRYVTTGDPHLVGGTAMPVLGDRLVIPAGRDQFEDWRPRRVAVFRNPGDSLNWVCTGEPDFDSPLAAFLGRMESIQYTLTGREPSGLSFYKGMLGVIPDANWPKDWGDHCLVVCNTDRKACSSWREPGDPGASKNSDADESFVIRGCLVATQWFAEGNCVGVPYEAIQNKLAGDYDGDQVVLLSGDAFPCTFDYIDHMLACAESAAVADEADGSGGDGSGGARNPKLKKTFTPLHPRGSRGNCIRKISYGSLLTGKWSNLAATLLCIKSEHLEEIAGWLGYPGMASLLRRASVGIKQGTDAFKTDVDVRESMGEADRIAGAIKGIDVPHIHMKRERSLFCDESHMLQVGGLRQEAWKSQFWIDPELVGVSVALMRRLAGEVRPPIPPDVSPLMSFSNYVRGPEGDSEIETVNALRYYGNIIIIRHPVGARGILTEWREAIGVIEAAGRHSLDRLAELAWYALHAEGCGPVGMEAWRIGEGVFTGFREHILRILLPELHEPYEDPAAEREIAAAQDPAYWANHMRLVEIDGSLVWMRVD